MRNRKRDPETYYAGDDVVRATAAGDSTLRVCKYFFSFFIFK